MKRLCFVIVFFFFLAAVPFAFASPDAPSTVWLTNVENPPFDNDGTLTVNWDPVTNEDIIRYNIIVSDATSGQMLLLGTNTTANTFLLSGYTYGNYTFRVSAINSLDVEGPSTLSEWVYIDTTDPAISFVAPTPENNAYTKNNWTTISVSVTDTFLDSVIINWNGVDTLFNDPSGVIRSYPPEMPAPGKYMYYVQANDSAGNSIKSEMRYINYDITKPLVSLSSPQSDAVYNTSSIPLEYVANDTSSITCWYEYNFVNTTLSDCRPINFNPTYGNKTNLTLWVSDAAGNIESAFVSFTASAPTPPEIISTIPVNGKVLEAPSLSGNFNGVVSITTSKQAYCRYSLTPNISFDLMSSGFSGDTNSNMQNITVTLTDKTNYLYYVRCKSSDNVVNSADYVVQFSTAAPDGLIILDPDGMVLKNGTVRIEAIKGVSSRTNMPIKTRASYDVTGLTASVSGEIASSVGVELPTAITNSRLSNITIVVMPNVLGLSKTNITLHRGDYAATFSADIITYDDFYPEFVVFDQISILNTSESIAKLLNSTGVSVADKTTELERIKSEIPVIRSLYSSGSPFKAREKYLQLNESLNLLNANILRAGKEYSDSIASKSNSTDNSSDSGGIGGISLSTIVIVIIVVIIVIIIAASYVPEKGEENAPAAVPQSPGNEGFQIFLM